jgi:uncharacterized protein YbaP (TraB family)
MSREHIQKPSIYRYRIILVCLVSLLIALSASAPGVSEAWGRHLIWSVKGKNCTLNLMGSVHTLRSDVYPLPDTFQQVYEKAVRIVFETEMDRMADPGIQARLLSMGLYPEGETIKDHLSPDSYKAFSDLLAKRGIPSDQFLKFKPWFCAFSLTMLEFQRLGYNPQNGLDVHFFSKAKMDGKSLTHLEPIDAQIQLLASLDKERQEEFLLQALQEIKVLESMAKRMTEAWRTGNADGLYKIIQMGFKGFPDLYKKFIIKRNQNWLPRLEDLLRGNEDVLVIVGAGHLVGPHSVVNMLKDQGYIVHKK